MSIQPPAQTVDSQFHKLMQFAQTATKAFRICLIHTNLSHFETVSILFLQFFLLTSIILIVIQWHEMGS
jgi:hypothetical protein